MRRARVKERALALFSAIIFAVSCTPIPVYQSPNNEIIFVPEKPDFVFKKEPLDWDSPIFVIGEAASKPKTKDEKKLQRKKQKSSPKKRVSEKGHAYSDADIRMISQIAYLEAGNQSEIGIRWVVDSVLNRVESSRFPNSVRGVLLQKSQFTTAAGLKKAKVRPDIVEIVKDEIENRTNGEVIAFRTGHYHKWGKPIAKIGEHYFNK